MKTNDELSMSKGVLSTSRYNRWNELVKQHTKYSDYINIILVHINLDIVKDTTESKLSSYISKLQEIDGELLEIYFEYCELINRGEE